MDMIILKQQNAAGCSWWEVIQQTSSCERGTSGVCPGSLLFLTFINDLPAAVSSQTRLFADDCILYRPIRHFSDCETLQNDVDKLAQWEQQWRMQFHPSKCNSMSVTRSKTHFKYNYILKGHTLESIETAKYLGITISSIMTWNAHINNITSKAQKLLRFLRRNLQIKNEHTKSMAYKSLVRSNLEYCSTIWSPHTNKQKNEIEKVQRRAARYTNGRFHNTSSVTSMLDHLKWNSLETRRNIAKVTMLYTVTHNLVAINPDFYISSQTSITRHGHSLWYKPFSTSTDYFKFSFFPHTVVLWNTLPPDIVSASSLDKFKSQIQTHYI